MGQPPCENIGKLTSSKTLTYSHLWVWCCCRVYTCGYVLISKLGASYLPISWEKFSCFYQTSCAFWGHPSGNDHVSHLWKRKTIFNSVLEADMWVSRRVRYMWGHFWFPHSKTRDISKESLWKCHQNSHMNVIPNVISFPRKPPKIWNPISWWIYTPPPTTGRLLWVASFKLSCPPITLEVPPFVRRPTTRSGSGTSKNHGLKKTTY